MSTRGKIGFVLFFLAVCASSVLLTSYFQMRVEHVRPAELYSVVFRQVNAVRVDNYSTAYEQVSNTFQRKFNLNQFIGVVHSDYSGISKSVHVEIGRIQSRGGVALMRVYFIDRQGQVVPCVYTLVNEGDVWKIDGARVLKPWPTGSRIAGIRI
jgi:hypothetical protein